MCRVCVCYRVLCLSITIVKLVIGMVSCIAVLRLWGPTVCFYLYRLGEESTKSVDRTNKQGNHSSLSVFNLCLLIDVPSQELKLSRSLDPQNPTTPNRGVTLYIYPVKQNRRIQDNAHGDRNQIPVSPPDSSLQQLATPSFPVLPPSLARFPQHAFPESSAELSSTSYISILPQSPVSFSPEWGGGTKGDGAEGGGGGPRGRYVGLISTCR